MFNKWKTRGFLGVLAAILVLAVAPIASAHHATVTASLDCNGVITYTVQSWEGHTNDNGGVNNDVYLQDSLGNTFPTPHGAFNDADNYQFSGTFTIPTSVTSDTLTPVTGKWGDNTGGDTYSQYATTVHRPTDCKVAPTLSTTASGPVTVGAAIHDSAHVSGSNGTPTGTVTFQVFAPGDTNCATPLTPAPSSGSLNGSGDATSGNFTTAAVGTYRWIAHYGGDNHYNAVDGTCNGSGESSTVTTATPTLSTTASGPVTVGAAIHDSAHVSGSAGTPTGTVTFQVFAPGDTTCATPLTPAPTSGALNGSGDATSGNFTTTTRGAYRWIAHYSGDATYSPVDGACNAANESSIAVDARITISPNATNEVGSPHTFTVTVQDDPGTGTFVAFQGATEHVTLTDSNGSSHAAATGTCVTGTTDANGQCTIVVNSSTPGQVGIHVQTTLTVLGQLITRATADNVSGDSSDDTKTFVDSYITITPATATNPLNATHVFTATVFVNDGSGAGYVLAPNGTPVTFSFVGGHVGSFTSSATCTTTGGSCKTTDVSSTAGDDTVRATTTLTVGGVSMTRATGTTTPGHANSSDAVKHWQGPPPSSPSNPAISITKSPKSQTISSGSTASFSITVTNSGDVTLTNVNVTDPLSPDCAKTSAAIQALASMASGASVSYNCSLGNVTAGFTNVATATGTPPSGGNVTATDSAQVIVTTPLTPPPAPAKPVPAPAPTKPAIEIVKDPNAQTIGVGGTATFKITVTNTGDVTLSDVTVTDPKSPDCNKSLGTLGVGKSKSYSCTKENVSADFQNVATATGKPPTGATVKAADHANVTVKAFIPPQHPRIAIAKNPNEQTVSTKFKTTAGANGANKTTIAYGTASFTIKVTNTGDVTLHDVTVSDPLSSNCNKSLGTLAAHKSKTYACTRPAVTANFTNVANATGTSPKGVKVHASDTANVKVITKTASTSGALFTG